MKSLQKKCRLFVIDEAHCLKTWGESATKREKPFRKLFKDLAQIIATIQVFDFALTIEYLLVNKLDDGGHEETETTIAECQIINFSIVIIPRKISFHFSQGREFCA